MKYASDTVHKLGMKFSVYNTMRELSDRCMELFAMIENPMDGAGECSQTVSLPLGSYPSQPRAPPLIISRRKP